MGIGHFHLFIWGRPLKGLPNKNTLHHQKKWNHFFFYTWIVIGLRNTLLLLRSAPVISDYELCVVFLALKITFLTPKTCF